MEYKPSDLFVSVIDFFGILVPGAVLMFLHGEYLLRLLGKAPSDDKVFYWIGFFVGFFLLGHFLTGLGVLLLNWAYRLSLNEVDLYYKEVEQEISLPVPKKNRKDAYHRAYSFIRLNSAAGIAEIDRHVAEYKLFRALAIAFVIDRGFAFAALEVRHIIVSALIVLLSWFRFATLVCWTQRITFEYYVLLTKTKETKAQP